jgi:MFS family permease
MKKVTAFMASLSPGFWVALGVLAVQLPAVLSGGFGMFRDEFYYIACSDHLAWGYVDHPPLSILFLRLLRLAFGDSLITLRLVPALAVAALAWLSARLARELGGSHFAQFLAALACGVAPVYLAVGSFYSMNIFEPLCWMGCAWLLLRMIDSGRRELWLPFGVLAGLALLNKHSMLFFGAALVAGLLLTRERRLLAGKWPWIGGAIALWFLLPNLVWLFRHDWATLEFMRNAQQWKNMPMSPLEFLSAQVLLQHPLTLPLWLAGLAALLFHPRLKKYRGFAFAFVLLFILFVAQRGKPYYLSPFFPLLLAAGAVLGDRLARSRLGRGARAAYAALLLVGGLVMLPMWVPLLPVETHIRYTRAIGLTPPRMERTEETELHQVYADRFGWREMVAVVAGAYDSLSPEERTGVGIFTQNYGQAGAVDFYGGRYGLPKAISGHNNYWLWGPGERSGKVLIIIGGRREDHLQAYEEVTLFAVHNNRYAMPSETGLPIWICRRPKVTLEQIWPEVKHFG